MSGSLFDFLEAPSPLRSHAWTPEAPPSLSGIHDIELNVETTGFKWWDGDKAIAAALRVPDGRTWYLPWGHRGGGNLDEAVVKEWAKRELRGKRITNINTRFDVHHFREWDIDLEAQGNEVSDVAHYAALLDDHRRKFNLDLLIVDLFGHSPEIPRLDESRMADAHAGEAAPRSMYNVTMVRKLRDLMWPMLDAQDLQPVRALEDKVIYPVCEMEKNGSPIDLELLDRWEKASLLRVNSWLMEISQECGFQVNPDSPKDMARIFQKFGLPLTLTTPGDGKPGKPSFTAAILKQIKHPTIEKIRRCGKLIDIRTKYLVKYKRCICSNGILRYALHQLRTQKDNEDENSGDAGTVTGRFSSAELMKAKEGRPGVGLNIQQVMKVAKQRISWGYEEDDDSHDDELFIIRQLHVPGSGKWLSADAAQIEYRLFANYARNKKIIEAYKAEVISDPKTWISFHKLTWGMIKPYKPDQSYRQQKDLNFAKIYGAKIIKLAVMLEFISSAEGEQMRKDRDYNNPKLAPAKAVERIYNRELPEVAPLQKKASHLFMPACSSYCNVNDKLHREFEHQGFVRDLLGRRQRCPDGDRVHKALNMVIQPGAATINKQKLVELHAEREYTNFLMRFTVHDEVDGDARDEETEGKVREILNRQAFPELTINILWDVKTGKNWKECA